MDTVSVIYVMFLVLKKCRTLKPCNKTHLNARLSITFAAFHSYRREFRLPCQGGKKGENSVSGC